MTQRLTFLLVITMLLFSSCRTLSYFESPNNLRNITGTLYLQNGQSYTGKLVVETENIFGSPVRLFTEGDRRPMQFKLDDVEGYTIRNEHYEVKEIRESFIVGRQLYFMKRLTPKESRIHLFQFSRKETVNKTKVRHTPEYYLQLPNEHNNIVHASNGSQFVPHFEEKVSRLVQDCPALAQKVAEKRPGYFYAQVSLVTEKRAEVLMKIIEEYNQCASGTLK